MTILLADNRAARDAILGRVRNALGKTGSDAGNRTEAEAYLTAHAQGPRPAMPADLVVRFMQRATDMASTVERLPSLAAVPDAVARYLDALVLPPALAAQKSHTGVCWPELATLEIPVRFAGLAIERIQPGLDRTVDSRFARIADGDLAGHEAAEQDGEARPRESHEESSAKSHDQASGGRRR